MAYKKYITKNGKIYGPYVYHSKRVDGKVVSEYHGLKKDKKSKKKVWTWIAATIILFLMFWILFFSIKFSGRVVLDISENYQAGEPVKGSININLQQGELIPSTAKLTINNGGEIQTSSLKKLLEDKIQTGNYYLKEINISNEGEGFGLEGEIEKIPEITFKFKVISQTNEQTPTNETIENTTQENTTIEENTTTTEPLEENETSATITGNVISEDPSTLKKFFTMLTGKATEETIKQGKLSKDSPYTYTLEENQTVEIIEVSADENKLPLESLTYSLEDKKVIFSTNYSEIEKGFGEKFLGKEETTLQIDFNNLEKPIEEGLISIEMEYNGTSLMNFEGEITPKKTQTEIIITKTPLEKIPLELTQSEKQTLIETFGQTLIQTTSYKYKNKILVEFELGQKNLEHSYDSRLGVEETLLSIEEDKVLWLKDLAREANFQKTNPVREETFDNNYSII